MKTMRKIAAIALVLMLAAGTACADTLSLNGTIEYGETVPVYAPIGGTVENVAVEQGMRVNAGDTLFSYRTDKTYASEDGTVSGVFVQPGDDAETVTERFGADLYIVPESEAEAYSGSFRSVEGAGFDPAGGYVRDGELWGIKVWDAASRTGIATEYIRYPDEDCWLFINAKSVHAAALTGTGDDAALAVARALLTIK